MIIVVVFIVFAFGLFTFLIGLDTRNQKARAIRDRLAAVDNAAAREPEGEAALLRDELLSSVPAFNRILEQSSSMKSLQDLLSQADLKMRAGKLILICACAGSTLALIVNWLYPGVFAFVALAFGCALPVMFVRYLRSRRFNKFEELFPHAIDLLGRAVRAGHSFSTSLELIATELEEPVSGEFRKVYEEQKFGLPMRDSLLNLGTRIPLVDVRFFTVSVLLQREAGGNLAEILDKLSYVIRERFRIARQVRVFTAQGRMSMMILISMPFLLAGIIGFIAPESMRLLVTDPLGKRLVGFGLCSLVVGYVTIKKIIKIRV